MYPAISPSSCSSPFTASNLNAGVEYSFKVRAIDSFGNKDATRASLSWLILTPQQAIEQLIQFIKSMNLDHGLQTSLIASLNAAEKSLTQQSCSCMQSTQRIYQQSLISGPKWSTHYRSSSPITEFG
jgi:hypothetical protein